MEAHEREREWIVLVAGQDQDASSGWESDCLVVVGSIGQGEPTAKLEVVMGWCHAHS